MPVPFLVPAIGALVGTAAAPALGMSAALAAGLGGGIATLAAGGSPEEALLSGATAGIGSALMPGITSGIQSMAGQAGKAAAKGAAQGAAQGAGAQMTKEAVTQAATAGAGTAPTQIPQVINEAGFKIDPKKALEFGLKTAAKGGQRPQQQAAAPNLGPLPLSLGGGQQTSGDVMQSFTSGFEAGDLQMPAPAPAPQPGVEPVMGSSRDIEMKRIPLQMGYANGGLASLAGDEMARRGMNTLPNLGDREQAYMMAQREFAKGGYIEGPGTGTSDDIDAMIYQNGVPVQEAMLSDGEVVLSHKDLKALDPDGDSYRAGKMIGNAPNGTRGKKAAEMFLKMKEAA